MTAREWFDCQVNAFVSLQIVIAVEALNALIALERPIGQGIRLWLLVMRTIHSVKVAVSRHETARHGHGHL